VTATPAPRRPDPEIAWWDVHGQVSQMINIFATVAEREQERICTTQGIAPLGRESLQRLRAG
jgi:hypothetical protein